MKEACAELTESIYKNSRIYSLPEKAEMLSDTETVVAIDFAAKNFAEADNSLSDDIKSYLENVVIEKLMDNSNFIRKMMVKKVVKEVVIDYAKDSKSKYEEAVDVMPIGRNTYYLTKEKGKWLINKIEVEDLPNQEYDEEPEGEGHYEDGDEEASEGMEDELEDVYYEDEITAQYILLQNSKEYLSEDDVEILSEEECRIARNEILA